MSESDLSQAEINALLEDDSFPSVPKHVPDVPCSPLTTVVVETPKKRRGRPSIQQNTCDFDGNWTSTIIDVLFEQKSQFTRLFADARKKESGSMAWSRVTLSVSTLCKINF